MTGLYNNIDNLQNRKDLTFLHRTPKFILGSLNLNRIAGTYKKIFHLTETAAQDMANLTGGYSFAFQVLGYFTWENDKKLNNEVLKKYDDYIAEYSYDKIYSELSPNEKKIVKIYGKFSSKAIKTADILKESGFSSEIFNVYRQRLIRKGVVATAGYGYSRLVLPRFDIFLKNKSSYNNKLPDFTIIDEN